MKFPKLGVPSFKQTALEIAGILILLASSWIEGAKSEEQTREIVRDEISKLKETKNA